MIELLFFMKLYFPDKDITIEQLNKNLNKKTFGSLLKKYNEKYPDDPYNLGDILEICINERNSFMHNFYINIVLLSNQESGLGQCNSFFKSFESNADILFKKITELELT